MASNMDTCAECGNPTQKSCAACQDAPLYEPAPGETTSFPSPKPTFYCGTECQKTGWKTHKTTCKILEARVKLQRVGQLLKRTFLTIRKHAYDRQISAVRVKDNNTIILSASTNEPFDAYRMFPLDLFQDVDKGMLEAVLLEEACDFPMLYCGKILPELLQGIPGFMLGGLEAATHSFSPAIRKYTVMAGDLNRGGITNQHTVLRLNINSETWVIDATAPQITGGPTVLPYATYVRNHNIRGTLEAVPFTQATTFQALEFGMMMHPNVVRAAIGLTGLEAAIDNAVPDLEAAVGGSLSRVLRGSPAVFSEQLAKVMGSLEKVVREYMAIAYSKENLDKLNKELRDYQRKKERAAWGSFYM